MRVFIRNSRGRFAKKAGTKKAANRPRNNRGRFTRNNRATRKAFAPTHVRKTRKSTRKNRKH